MDNVFRKRLQRGERLIGTMVTSTDPAVAETLAATGFDWLFIDAEHGSYSNSDLAPILRAVDFRIPCIVRVPVFSEEHIKKTLDLGAGGIIAPQVNTAAHAESVVRYSRYSPEGSRGVGLARAHGYGLNFQEYVDSANEQVTVIVQAEHARAVENIEDIARVPGVDAVLVGPYDLSASLGKMGQVDDPVVVQAIEHVTVTCRDAGIPLGIFGVTLDAVRPWIERGFTLLVVGVDLMLLAQAAGGLLKATRISSDSSGQQDVR